MFEETLQERGCKLGSEKLRIVDLSYFYASETKDYKQLIKRYESGSDHLSILARLHDLSVIRHLDQNTHEKIGDVNYFFFRGSSFKAWLPFRLHNFVNKLNPEIILLHGFHNPLQILLLHFQTSAIAVIQDHGGGIPSGVTGLLQSLVKYFVKNYFFTSKEQALAFVQRGLIRKQSRIFEIMEGSTHKKRILKSLARKILKIEGNQTVFLWVGRLDENKDPLTVLKGFELFLKVNSNCCLFMIYADNKLESEVFELIENSAVLKPAVKLIGKVPHADLDTYYSSADFFVLGSHYEGSGFALCEAMACGCIPIVTDIPSFRMITNNGIIGVLWQVGNKNSLFEALEKTPRFNIEEEALNAVKFFEKELSFEAIARKQAEAFQSIHLLK
jgi:glycosyltransferase involved in cell wall biosynthesis